MNRVRAIRLFLVNEMSLRRGSYASYGCVAFVPLAFRAVGVSYALDPTPSIRRKGSEINARRTSHPLLNHPHKSHEITPRRLLVPVAGTVDRRRELGPQKDEADALHRTSKEGKGRPMIMSTARTFLFLLFFVDAAPEPEENAEPEDVAEEVDDEEDEEDVEDAEDVDSSDVCEARRARGCGHNEMRSASASSAADGRRIGVDSLFVAAGRGVVVGVLLVVMGAMASAQDDQVRRLTLSSALASAKSARVTGGTSASAPPPHRAQTALQLNCSINLNPLIARATVVCYIEASTSSLAWRHCVGVAQLILEVLYRSVELEIYSAVERSRSAVVRGFGDRTHGAISAQALRGDTAPVLIEIAQSLQRNFERSSGPIHEFVGLGLSSGRRDGRGLGGCHRGCSESPECDIRLGRGSKRPGGGIQRGRAELPIERPGRKDRASRNVKRECVPRQVS
ncbi:hypothetical protein DFH09DRAFT_1090856 [Mycena vulgaris]|nr:hypothetical protein DFH09DRAFT_1090856 [Mycena vulgaris]